MICPPDSASRPCSRNRSIENNWRLGIAQVFWWVSISVKTGSQVLGGGISWHCNGISNTVRYPMPVRCLCQLDVYATWDEWVGGGRGGRPNSRVVEHSVLTICCLSQT